MVFGSEIDVEFGWASPMVDGPVVVDSEAVEIVLGVVEWQSGLNVRARSAQRGRTEVRKERQDSKPAGCGKLGKRWPREIYNDPIWRG